MKLFVINQTQVGNGCILLEVNAYEGFTKGFLFGMSEHAGSECSLSMLVNDEEMSLAFEAFDR